MKTAAIIIAAIYGLGVLYYGRRAIVENWWPLEYLAVLAWPYFKFTGRLR